MLGAKLAQAVKTPGSYIFGVFLCLLFGAYAQAECGKPEPEIYKVARVSDGDTLKLANGDSVRVLGVNAPEVAHRTKTGQPLGVEAKASATDFIASAKNHVRLGFEDQRRDHYGRQLAHVYNLKGQSLAAHLLRDGMAMHIGVPPNMAQSECLFRFEQRARSNGKGVWSHQYWRPIQATNLKQSDTGFRLVRGVVKHVSVKKTIWLELDGSLAVKISAKDARNFDDYQVRDWLNMKGKVVEVRGWISRRKPPANAKKVYQPLTLQIRAPVALRVINKD